MSRHIKSPMTRPYYDEGVVCSTLTTLYNIQARE